MDSDREPLFVCRCETGDFLFQEDKVHGITVGTALFDGAAERCRYTIYDLRQQTKQQCPESYKDRPGRYIGLQPRT